MGLSDFSEFFSSGWLDGVPRDLIPYSRVDASRVAVALHLGGVHVVGIACLGKLNIWCVECRAKSGDRVWIGNPRQLAALFRPYPRIDPAVPTIWGLS